jgi:hypothetical protein
MELVSKLDDYGKPAWIAVMVLGFIVFWPVGLAILAYMIWSGRMGCRKHSGPGRWYNESESGSKRRGEWWKKSRAHPNSGNRAFDEYRQETLRRLEQESDEFKDFLENLRHARDKAEFDQFMKDRRDRAEQPEESESPESPAPQQPS